jgi:NADH-quinone oxidoreductase subunit J
MVTFGIIASLIFFSSIGVVFLRNPIYSALALVTCLLGVSALYASLGAHFLAATQIIVYGGAVVVLVLFVLMLLNLKVEPLSLRDITLQFLGIVFGLAFIGISIPSITSLFTLFPNARERYLSTPVVNQGSGTVQDIGRVLFSTYLFPFEVASVLIMVALVGAVMIGRKRNRQT